MIVIKLIFIKKVLKKFLLVSSSHVRNVKFFKKWKQNVKKPPAITTYFYPLILQLLLILSNVIPFTKCNDFTTITNKKTNIVHVQVTTEVQTLAQGFYFSLYTNILHFKDQSCNCFGDVLDANVTHHV